MQAYAYTYTQNACVLTCVYADTHTQIGIPFTIVQIDTHSLTFALACINTLVYAHLQICTIARTHTLMHVKTLAHGCMQYKHAHKRKHMLMLPCLHTYIRACTQNCMHVNFAYIRCDQFCKATYNWSDIFLCIVYSLPNEIF